MPNFVACNGGDGDINAKYVTKLPMIKHITDKKLITFTFDTFNQNANKHTNGFANWAKVIDNLYAILPYGKQE